MRYFIIASMLLALVGCQSDPAPTTQPAPAPIPEVKVAPPEVKPPELQPEIPKTSPVAPVTPTVPWLRGYRDGYYGTWLAPVRWAFANEYRGGWSAGAYDRKNGIPQRFK